MNAYLHVLRQRPLGLLLLASMLARIPQTINGLAVVLFLREQTGSFSTAGAVAGGLALGTGVFAPFVGRLADRRGPWSLGPVACGHAAGLVALLVLGGRASAAVLIVIATLTGGMFPPAGSVLRARFPLLLAEARDLLAPVYALDAVLVEVAFVIGPLITGLLVAVFAPGVALGVSAFFAVAGTLTFLRLLPPAAEDAVRPAAEHAGWLGPLRSPAIMTLVLTMLPFGFAIGALEVVMPAFSEDHGAPELAGVLLATWALGSAAGGLAYGSRPWQTGVASLHLRFTFLLPLAYLPVLLSGSIWAMALLVIPAGVLIAPTFASRNELVGLAAPTGTETEALTWPLTTLLCGISFGAALAGALIDAYDWRAAVYAALGGAIVGAVVSAARRTSLLHAVAVAG